MSTYLEVVQRIENDYLNRTDYRSEVKREVLSAVRFYERRRWRFNETATALATSSGQTFVSIPSNFLVLDSLEIEISGGRDELITANLATVLSMRASSATGQPTHFAKYGNQFEMAVVPDSAYSIQCYYIKTLTELSADADTNEWTTGAMQDLIVHRASKKLFALVIRDPAQAQLHQTFETEALNTAASEVEQFTQNKIRPTEF